MQFGLYLIVGGLSFIVDIGVFVALRAAAVPVIPASVVSFCFATGANYFLCILFAFTSGRFRRLIEVLRFIAIVFVGLMLNTVLTWYFVYRLHVQPVAAKIAVVPIVLIWNYLARRWFVFRAEIPTAVRCWLARWQGAFLGGAAGAGEGGALARTATRRPGCGDAGSAKISSPFETKGLREGGRR
jgi:putative flippase GtrA